MFKRLQWMLWKYWFFFLSTRTSSPFLQCPLSFLPPLQITVCFPAHYFCTALESTKCPIQFTLTVNPAWQFLALYKGQEKPEGCTVENTADLIYGLKMLEEHLWMLDALGLVWELQFFPFIIVISKFYSLLEAKGCSFVSYLIFSPPPLGFLSYIQMCDWTEELDGGLDFPLLKYWGLKEFGNFCLWFVTNSIVVGSLNMSNCIYYSYEYL